MLIASIILLAIILAVILSSKNKSGVPPGVGMPAIVFFLWAFWHPRGGDFLASIGRKKGPAVQAGLGKFKLLILNGADIIKEAGKELMLNGRADTMYKRILGTQGILWTDNSSQMRKFLFRNTRHFGLGGKPAENNIHEEISILFSYFNGFHGNPISVKHAFNIPTMNGVLHRFLGEKIPHDDPNFKSLVDRMALMMEVPNPLMRACFLVPDLAKWLPGSLSGQDLVQRINHDAFEMFEPYMRNHLKSRIPNQPRDLMDSLMDEVESTTDSQSPFHASSNNGSCHSSYTLCENPIFPLLNDLLNAAIETTAVMLEWVVLYLSQYPEVQAKLHAEVDSVIGSERLPELSDRSNMPYLQAFLQELFRIATVIPFAFHMALEDTILEGYTIEKGTSIIVNLYGIHMDPNLWDKPEELRPDRFIDEDGKFIRSDRIFVFGSGKRSCVGEVTARDQLFLYISRMVQSYNLIPEKKLKSFHGPLGLGNYTCSFKTSFVRRD